MSDKEQILDVLQEEYYYTAQAFNKVNDVILLDYVLLAVSACLFSYSSIYYQDNVLIGISLVYAMYYSWTLKEMQYSKNHLIEELREINNEIEKIENDK